MNREMKIRSIDDEDRRAALFDWPRETKSPLLCYRAIGGGRSVRRDVVVVVTKRVL